MNHVTEFDFKFMLIPANLSHQEGLFIVEMNFSEKNWVLCFSYNPRNNYTSTHTENGGKVIDSLSKLLIDKVFYDIHSF